MGETWLRCAGLPESSERKEGRRRRRPGARTRMKMMMATRRTSITHNSNTTRRLTGLPFGGRGRAAGLEQRGHLQVVCFKKVTKKVEVVLSQDVPSLGVKGEVKRVTLGHATNYLIPQGKAEVVTEQIMSKIQAEQDRNNAAKEEAQKFASAITFAKNFDISKEANEENTFGAFQMKEVQEAIKKKTGIDLSDDVIDLPTIKELGTFDLVAKFHPEVSAKFTVTVKAN